MHGADSVCPAVSPLALAVMGTNYLFLKIIAFLALEKRT
jgi:hypothetical protein